jgi:WD40 repeat protein
MGESLIVRKGGGAEVKITGQELFTGEYGESIENFDTVKVVFLPAVSQWDTSIIKLTNPAFIPQASIRGLSFSPDGTHLAATNDNSPFIFIYKRDGDTFTKLANPAALPTDRGNKVSFSPDGTYLAIGGEITPFITIYKRDGDTFTKLADPSVRPSSVAHKPSFSTDGTYLAVPHDAGNRVIIYKRNGDTFNTLLPEPGTGNFPVNLRPTGNGRGTSFSPDGTYLAIAHLVSPFITILKRDGDTFTKLANPATLPAGDAQGTAFSNDGTYLAVAHSGSPFITIYKRDGDTFTKLADPAALPASGGLTTTFTTDGGYLAVTHGTTPRITIYKRDGDTFTKVNDPATLPSGIGYDADFSPDEYSIYLAVAHQFPQYISIYKTTVSTEDTLIFKAENIIDVEADDLGYAIEDGDAGETKTIVSLFRKEEV